MLLQESTEKAVSVSALLVWLPKGPWWDPTLFGLTFCCSSPPFSWAGAEEDVFISSGDVFSDAVGEGVSVTGVLPLPPGQGCALCPRCQGCS